MARAGGSFGWLLRYRLVDFRLNMVRAETGSGTESGALLKLCSHTKKKRRTRLKLTTVSGISFVSMRGAWQNNSIFLIGFFKRLSCIVGRVACLVLVDNPCQARRTNKTYAWYRSMGL